MGKRAMNSARTSVEWGFGKIAETWKFLAHSRQMKMGEVPVGELYVVGALLTNCHTCLYGSLTNKAFGLNSPSLEWYMEV